MHKSKSTQMESTKAHLLEEGPQGTLMRTHTHTHTYSTCPAFLYILALDE